MLEAYCLDHFDEWVYCSPEVQDPTPVKLFLIPTSLNPCLAFLYFKLWSWICGIPLWAHFTLCLNLPKSESQHWVSWRPLWIIFTQVFILHVSIIETSSSHFFLPHTQLTIGKDWKLHWRSPQAFLSSINPLIPMLWVRVGKAAISGTCFD